MAVFAGEHGRAAAAGRIGRLHAHEHTDVAAQLLHQVVQPPPRCRLSSQRRSALGQCGFLNTRSAIS